METSKTTAKGRVIGEDFQGWPMHVLTVGELKQAIKDVGDNVEVWIYEDDGMAYCPQPMEATEVHHYNDKDREQLRIWFGGNFPLGTAEKINKRYLENEAG